MPAGLRWADLDLASRKARILGKGSKIRTVLIPKAAVELMELQRLSALCVSSPHACDHEGQGSARSPDAPTQLSPSTDSGLQERNAQPLHPYATTGTIFGVSDEALYQRFRRIARRAGVEAHPHQLRHTFATSMLAKGMSPLALQTLGGWANQAMVKRYAKAALADAALEEMRRLE